MRYQNLAVGAASMLFCGLAHAGAVVAAKGSSINSLSEDDVKKIFLGRESSATGGSVTILYQQSGSARSEFESKVLGRSGADLNAYWSKLIFTGKAAAPTEVDGDAGVKAKLASSPSTIGYISDTAINDSVKVLFKY